MKTLLRFLFCALLLSSAFLFTGCATNEAENLSERPWNSPRGWESGLPSSMNEGR
jgi:hypothetical protein